MADIEEAIEKLAQKNRWIKGAEESLEHLKAEGIERFNLQLEGRTTRGCSDPYITPSELPEVIQTRLYKYYLRIVKESIKATELEVSELVSETLTPE